MPRGTDATWRLLPPPPDGFYLDLSGAVGSAPGPLPSRLLYNREIRTDAAARSFLDPDLSSLSDPLDLPGVEQACSRILRSIRDREPIGIFGDFDVDGLTATAVMIETIRRLGGSVLPYIPHRETDGHGLSEQAVHAIASAGARLIVTVDTGTTAIKEVKAAREAGMDVVITDHHLAEGELPDAHAIVNPHLGAEDTTAYAGAGVAFKLATALCAIAKVEWPDSLLPLAAIGTVADSVPLVGENRIIVRAGLAELGRTRHPGLQALLQRSRPRGSHGRPDAELISFYVAPRLNAPGRLGDAEPSLQLLIAENVEDAEALADRLDRANAERRRLGDQLWRDATRQLRDAPVRTSVVAIRCDGYPAGLLGPLAGKLCDEYQLPAVA